MRLRAAALAVMLTACGAPEPPVGTGGVSLPTSSCGRGLVVVGSDHQSTNVSLTDRTGQVVSSSFLSSASASSGLSAPLSGDVVVPTEAALGDELLLLDRYPASVLTWASLETAEVRAQLDVGTGFAANPQDYLSLPDGRAYVTRYETNPAPGQEPFDGGGDVLVVDPVAPAVSGRIDLTEAMADAPGYLPRPGKMVRVGDRVYVLLAAYSGDFTDSAPSRLVTLDPVDDSVVAVTVLEGLHGCSALAASAEVDEAGGPVTPWIAVACTGKFAGDSTATVQESGLSVISVASTPPVEVARWPADALAGRALGFGLDFASADTLLVTVLGAFGEAGSGDEPDALIAVDRQTGAATEVLRGASLPFELGEVRCTTPLATEAEVGPEGCGACFVADAERNRLHRLAVGPGGSTVEASLVVDTEIGLPPRGLGRF